MNTTSALRNHSNYNADDYAYLVAKGWTDEKIMARWNLEAERGIGPCRWNSPAARIKLFAVTGRKLRSHATFN